MGVGLVEEHLEAGGPGEGEVGGGGSRGAGVLQLPTQLDAQGLLETSSSTHRLGVATLGQHGLLTLLFTVNNEELAPEIERKIVIYKLYIKPQGWYTRHLTTMAITNHRAAIRGTKYWDHRMRPSQPVYIRSALDQQVITLKVLVCH